MAYTDHAGDIMRVTLAFAFPNSQYQEVDINYQCAIAGTGDSRPALLGYADTGASVYLIPFMSTTCTYYGSKVSTIKALAKYSPKFSYQLTPGSSSGTLLPSQCRGLVSWKTQYSGRAYRGRSYMPTPTVSFLATGGLPTSSYTTYINNWAIYMSGPVISGGTTWIPGVYHRKPTADISSVFDPFTAAVASNLFATQRRAGAYGRPNTAPF